MAAETLRPSGPGHRRVVSYSEPSSAADRSSRHAEGGTRTPTGLRPLRPERSASTSSTTSAKGAKLAAVPTPGQPGPLTRRKWWPILCLGYLVSPRNTPAAERSAVGRPQPQGDPRLPHPRDVGGGIVLTGTEVKSLRNGKASIKEAYARVRNGEVFLEGMNITPYEQGNRYNHDPVRTRKLLLHRREIERLIGAVEQKGLTLVPLELYFQNGRAKVALALGRGKKQPRQAGGPEAPSRSSGKWRGRCRSGVADDRRSSRLLAGSRAGRAPRRGHHHRGPGRRAPGPGSLRGRPAPRSLPAPAAPRRAGRLDPGRGRVGRGHRGPATVPLPGGRAALRLQQPAPAAGRAGLG